MGRLCAKRKVTLLHRARGGGTKEAFNRLTPPACREFHPTVEALNISPETMMWGWKPAKTRLYRGLSVGKNG